MIINVDKLIPNRYYIFLFADLFFSSSTNKYNIKEIFKWQITIACNYNEWQNINNVENEKCSKLKKVFVVKFSISFLCS